MYFIDIFGHHTSLYLLALSFLLNNLSDCGDIPYFNQRAEERRFPYFTYYRSHPSTLLIRQDHFYTENTMFMLQTTFRRGIV
jgi:hypothetical protein